MVKQLLLLSLEFPILSSFFLDLLILLLFYIFGLVIIYFIQKKNPLGREREEVTVHNSEVQEAAGGM